MGMGLISPPLTTWEERWLRREHPFLRYFSSHRLIYGPFKFDATYNGERIIDTYRLSIDLTPKTYGRVPLVFEVGGRIKKAARLLNKPLADLHSNPDGTQCLIRPDAEFERFKYGIPLPQFFELLTSHFYWQSYVEKNGREPWAGEKHGWDPTEFEQWIVKIKNSISK